MGSSLIVGSAYHKNTNAKVERANGVIGDTLRAFANGRKDDWDRQLPLAVFAQSTTRPRPWATGSRPSSSTAVLTRACRFQLLPLLGTGASRRGSKRNGCASSSGRSENSWRRAAQRDSERKAKLDAGRVDTARMFKLGDQVLLRTQELLDVADISKLSTTTMGRPLQVHGHGLPQPQRLHFRASTPNAVQCDGQRRPAQALPRTDRRPTGTGSGVGPGAGG